MADAPTEFYVHVFIDHVDAGTNLKTLIASLGRLAGEDGPVRFAARYVGSFLAYAALDVLEPGGLETVQELIAEQLWDAGVHCQYSTEIKTSSIMGPHRGSPPYCALVRIRSSDPFGLLDALDAWWEATGFGEPGEEHWYGAAVVTGKDVDVLLDLHEPSFSDLKALLLEVLGGEAPDEKRAEAAQRVRALIGSTDTSFAYLTDNAVRRGEGS